MTEPRKCEHCETEIPEARLDAIPETTMCVKCAEVHGPKKRVGFMVSGAAKGTASVLVTVDPDDKEALRRAERAHRRER
jgi:RNA polymerase-binding transcription factor DksA